MNNLAVLLWSSFKLALRQLVRHKVRSFLTMLGLFIGVGGVVAIVSLGLYPGRCTIVKYTSLVYPQTGRQ